MDPTFLAQVLGTFARVHLLSLADVLDDEDVWDVIVMHQPSRRGGEEGELKVSPPPLTITLVADG